MAEYHYRIVLKKGDLLIELSSHDDYFISKQMHRWYQALLPSSPARMSDVGMPPRKVSTSPPEENTSRRVEPQAVALPKTAPPLEKTTDEVNPVETVIKKSVVDADTPPVENRVVEVAETTEPPAPPVSKAPVQNPVENVESIVSESQPVQKTAGEPVIAETVMNDFEAVMDSLMEEFGKPEDELEASPLLTEETIRGVPGFTVLEPELEVLVEEEEITEESILAYSDSFDPELEDDATGNNGGKVNLEMIDSLAELFEKVTAKDPEENLLLTAFYLDQIEKVEKFSLKRINAAIVKAGLVPVNHSVFETALNKNWIEMVPDLTGMAEVTEYCLTSEGQKAGEKLL